MTDTVAYRIVLAAIAAALVLSIAGEVLLAALGRPAPHVLAQIAISCITGAGALLAPGPRDVTRDKGP
jgi:hypothetical protein